MRNVAMITHMLNKLKWYIWGSQYKSTQIKVYLFKNNYSQMWLFSTLTLEPNIST